MNRPRRWSAMSRALALLLIVLVVPGCSSSRYLKGPFDANRPVPAKSKTLRVHLMDSSKLDIRNPTVDGDSLRGTAEMEGHPVAYRRAVSVHPVAVALTDVRAVEWRSVDGLKTAGLVIGIAAVAIAALAVAIGLSGGLWGGATGQSVGSGGQMSCPLIDSWTGAQWLLDSGTFGGAIFQPLARTDVDPLVALRPVAGQLRLRLRNVAPETDHIDALALVAVDHPAGTVIAPDAAGQLHALTPAAFFAPVAAVDDRGRDARALVTAEDERFWESSITDRDPANDADVVDGLELTFPRPAGVTTARLVLDARNSSWAAMLMSQSIALHGGESAAWYETMNADTLAARRAEERIASEAFLRVSVWDGRSWRAQGRIREAGPEVAKRQVHGLDLGAVPGDVVRVRLESAPSLWLIDRVALDPSPAAGGVTTSEPLRMVQARDGAGTDVAGRLARADAAYLSLEPGDSAFVAFADLPAPDPAHVRSYVARTTGWYRVHGPETGEPDRETLARLTRDPHAIGRISVERINQALHALAAVKPSRNGDTP